jgi:hypothetical protein
MAFLPVTAFSNCLVLMVILGVLHIYSAKKINMSYNLPKRRLMYTVICISMAHVIAWIPVDSAWLLIFVLSCIDGYMLLRADQARLRKK